MSRDALDRLSNRLGSSMLRLLAERLVDGLLGQTQVIDLVVDIGQQETQVKRTRTFQEGLGLLDAPVQRCCSSNLSFQVNCDLCVAGATFKCPCQEKGTRGKLALGQ